MIEDLRTLDNHRTLSVDVCVIGAGPAGITIAKELIGSGLRVCVAEGGGFEEEEATQALYQGESVGHPVTMDEGRYRVYGGSGTRWSGRCAMLDPIDFQVRDWIPMSGWPFGLEHLRSYYKRAQVASGFQRPWHSEEEVAHALGLELPELGSKSIRSFIWRFALVGYHQHFNWGRHYRQDLAADRNTHVLLHANLTSFKTNRDGARVEAVTVASLSGIEMKIEATMFVLCCGGIENVRLLFNGPENMLRRANANDQLGRYFAQHPRGVLATLKTTLGTARRLQDMFNGFWRRRRNADSYEIGFALTEAAQREHGLVNASAAMYYSTRPGTHWEAIDRLRNAIRSRDLNGIGKDDLLAVLRNAGSLGANAMRRLFLDIPAVIPDPQVTIVGDFEQVPNADSRVTLSDQKDHFGMNRAKVDWRISEIERKTARHFNSFIADELRKQGLGEPDASAWLTEKGPLRDTELYGTYHHIGATRMSVDPRQGVVDADCRIHSVENLFISGCSVFPSGGHANPTLTIVALAIRLADHLKEKLGKSSSAMNVSPAQVPNQGAIRAVIRAEEH